MLLALPASLAGCDGEVGAPPQPSDEPPKPPYDPATSSASVSGRVTFEGSHPQPRYHTIKGCEMMEQIWRGRDAADEAVAVSAGGGIPHVFVWADNGPHRLLGGYQPAGEVVVRSELSYFKPHVFGVLAGQEFTIANADLDQRYLRVTPRRNPVRVLELARGEKSVFRYTTPEMNIPVTDSKHPWMSAWAFVMSHPFFAVTGDDGAFEIGGLPAGDYTFRAWHETFGVAEFQITVGDGESAAHDLTMTW
jgi:hypothetical protein